MQSEMQCRVMALLSEEVRDKIDGIIIVFSYSLDFLLD